MVSNPSNDSLLIDLPGAIPTQVDALSVIAIRLEVDNPQGPMVGVWTRHGALFVLTPGDSTTVELLYDETRATIDWARKLYAASDHGRAGR